MALTTSVMVSFSSIYSSHDWIFFRLIAGPTNADRAVALDTLNTLAIAAMIILAVIKDSVVMVDVAIVYAALSFVGTMFIARHIEGGM